MIEKETQISKEYTIALAQNIPANNKGYMVNIISYDLGVNFHYYAVPKVNQSAFFLTDIYNWHNCDLMPSQANIFFEGAYVGKTFIDPNSTCDTLSISSTDKDVQVKRIIKNEQSGIKLLGLKKKLNYSYDYTILNNKAGFNP